MDKLRVSLLGSTGMVGQKMVKLLASHPYIELVKVSASEGKIGKRYEESVKWIEQGEIPEAVRDMKLVSTKPEDHKDVDFVLSSLPNETAESVELNLVREGIKVISNASPYRMEPDVPLINPEVNWEHLKVLDSQRERRGWRGYLVKNPNCTASILSMPFKPLEGVRMKRVTITTLQAASGAGYGGVPFMALEGNVIPFIKGEDDKIGKEMNKMLGEVKGGVIRQRDTEIYATATRVPVRVGHMGVVNAEVEEKVDLEKVKDSMRKFRSLPQERNLPTAPRSPIRVFSQEDRPQPLLDVANEKGMGVSVGRISYLGDLLRFVVLGDNLVRGAAGISILTLEVMKELGYA